MFALSLKKKGDAIAWKGTFHYLYRVLRIGRAIAMVRVNHRGGVLESSRWSVSVIAMNEDLEPLVLRNETVDFRKSNLSSGNYGKETKHKDLPYIYSQ